MIVKCTHGFYFFKPESAADYTQFSANTGFDLVPFRDGYTFPLLASLGSLSIAGQAYGNLVANVNFCADPWAVLRANQFVYDLEKGQLVELDSVTDEIALYEDFGGATIARVLPQAGATYDFKRLLSFYGVSRFENKQFVLRTYELQDASI